MGNAMRLISGMRCIHAPLSCSLSLRGEGWGEGAGPLHKRCAWLEAGAGNSPRQASHFLLSRQKKVTKEKATPLRATLRFATGNLRCSLFAGSAQTRFAQTMRGPYPPEAALLGTRRGDEGQRAMARTCVGPASAMLAWIGLVGGNQRPSEATARETQIRAMAR